MSQQQTASPPTPVGIGIDTGGTHTDLVLVSAGSVRTLKVPTTPDDLNDGIVDGLMQILAQAGLRPQAVERFVYASTFVTNLIVEGKARPLGLITTSGFRDVLQIGRASRKPDVYDIHWRPPVALVPRHLRLTVVERMNHEGEVVEPLDEASVARRWNSSRPRVCKASRCACCTPMRIRCMNGASPSSPRRCARRSMSRCRRTWCASSASTSAPAPPCVNAFITRPITRPSRQPAAGAGGDRACRAPPVHHAGQRRHLHVRVRGPRCRSR